MARTSRAIQGSVNCSRVDVLRSSVTLVEGRNRCQAFHFGHQHQRQLETKICESSPAKSIPRKVNKMKEIIEKIRTLLDDITDEAEADVKKLAQALRHIVDIIEQQSADSEESTQDRAQRIIKGQ